MKLLQLLIVEIFFSFAAVAQQTVPAQMGLTPLETPWGLYTLDPSNNWAKVGTIDPTSHVLVSPFSVINNAALQAVSILIPGQTVHRQGFTVAGDGGQADYVFSSSACTQPDNGAQVTRTAGGCWILVPSAAGVDIRIWGAKADNQTDIGQFIQAAYNANVGCILVPRGPGGLSGMYYWNTAVMMNAQTPCFKGGGWNENVLNTSYLGTWFHINNTSILPATITGINGQGGVGGFSDMAFYEDQPVSVTGWTPNLYQYIFTLLNNGGRVDLNDILFYNVTHCASVSGSARIHFEKIYGQPVGTCLTFDSQHDVFTLRDVELWPFWTNDPNILGYNATIDPIVYGRADSPYGDNIFTLGYHSTLAFIQTANGVTTGAQFGSIESDATMWGLWIEPGASLVQMQIANFRGDGESAVNGSVMQTGSECLRADGNSDTISVANFECFGSGSDSVHLYGNNDIFQYGNFVGFSYNWDNNSSVALNAGTASYITGPLPEIANQKNNGAVIPPSNTGTQYAVGGIRQYWTPTLSAPTVGAITYAYNVGTYWFDGSRMTLIFNISATGMSGWSGNLVVKGLPGTMNAAPNQNTYCQLSSWAGFVLASGYSHIDGEINPGSNQIVLTKSGQGLGTVPVASTEIPSGAVVMGGTCIIAVGG